MRAAVVANFYSGLAVCILFLHALFILWVVFGALLTRSRPVLRWLHIISLLWGIATELLPWPCPLTLLENWLERRAGNSSSLQYSLDESSSKLRRASGVLSCDWDCSSCHKASTSSSAAFRPGL